MKKKKTTTTAHVFPNGCRIKHLVNATNSRNLNENLISETCRHFLHFCGRVRRNENLFTWIIGLLGLFRWYANLFQWWITEITDRSLIRNDKHWKLKEQLSVKLFPNYFSVWGREACAILDLIKTFWNTCYHCKQLLRWRNVWNAKLFKSNIHLMFSLLR